MTIRCSQISCKASCSTMPMLWFRSYSPPKPLDVHHDHRKTTEDRSFLRARFALGVPDAHGALVTALHPTGLSGAKGSTKREAMQVLAAINVFCMHSEKDRGCIPTTPCRPLGLSVIFYEVLKNTRLNMWFCDSNSTLSFSLSRLLINRLPSEEDFQMGRLLINSLHYTSFQVRLPSFSMSPPSPPSPSSRPRLNVALAARVTRPMIPADVTNGPNEKRTGLGPGESKHGSIPVSQVRSRMIVP